MKEKQTEKTQTAKTQEAVKKTQAPKTATYIYIGPSVRGTATTGDVYTGTREGALKAFKPLIKNFAGSEKLIVKAEEAVAARAQIRNKTGVYYHAYSNFGKK